MKIDYSALVDAYQQLQTSIDYLHSPLAADDEGLRKQFRNSVIQCFEFTYELTYKLLKRQLGEILETRDAVKQLNFADLIRQAAQAGLVSRVQPFLEYRAMRNLTSHTYDEDKAEKILTVLASFCEDVEFVIEQLRQRNL